MNLECKGYAGHKWSDLPPKPNMLAWCIRCHELYPGQTSIYNDHLPSGPVPFWATTTRSLIIDAH